MQAAMPCMGIRTASHVINNSWTHESLRQNVWNGVDRLVYREARWVSRSARLLSNQISQRGLQEGSKVLISALEPMLKTLDRP